MSLEKEIQKAVYLTVDDVYLNKLIENSFTKPITTTKARIANSWELEPTGYLEFEFSNPEGIIVSTQNFGRKPGIIKAKYKKFLRFKDTNKRGRNKYKIPNNQVFKSGGFIFAKAVYHPGFKGRRYIDSVMHDQKLFEKFTKELDKRLKKIFDKYFE